MSNIVKQQFRLDQGVELIFDFNEDEKYFDVNEAANAIISFVKEKKISVPSIEKHFDPNFEYGEDDISYYQINIDATYFPKEDDEDVEFSSINIHLYSPHFGDCDNVASYDLKYSEKISTEMVISSFEKMFLLLEMDLA